MLDQINLKYGHARDVQYRRECLQQRTQFRSLEDDGEFTLSTLLALSGKRANAEHAVRLNQIVCGAFGMPVSPHDDFQSSALHIAKHFIESFEGEWDDGRLFRLGTDVCRSDEEDDEQMIAWHLVSFVMTACPRRLIEIRRVVDEMLWLLSDGR